MYKKTTLKNGLRIITVPSKNTKSMTVLVLIGTGSKYEKKEINGISHFLEHMYFKGTKKRPSSLAVAESLDKLGGMYNAFTSEEYTGYYAKVAAPHWEIALEWVSDIFLNSLLPAEEIEKEKGVIIEEINMFYDHPMSYVNILWSELLYGDQPAGWSVSGTKETVNQINRVKLVDYLTKQYVASNTIVCFSGNINEKEIIKKAEEYFESIGVGQFDLKEKVIEKQTVPQSLISYRKTDQTHLCLGVRAYNLFHPDKYALEIMAVILGGMMSSRLFEEVRTKLGLAYYIQTASVSDPDTGFLVTQIGADNNNVEKAISAILEHYNKLTQEEVPAAELTKAKEYIKGKASLQLEASDVLASFYAGQELLEKKVLSPEEIFKKVDKVSSGDILKVAKDIFRPEKLNMALIGPFEDKEKFNQILKL